MPRSLIGTMTSKELLAHRRAQLRGVQSRRNESRQSAKSTNGEAGRVERFIKAWREGLEVELLGERFGMTTSEVRGLARRLGL